CGVAVTSRSRAISLALTFFVSLMRSVWWLYACSTLTLTLPLLFSPPPLGSRRAQLLPEFPPQRSPFLPRPPLPVPLKILQAPLPLPRLRSSLLPRRPLERPLRHLPRQPR